MRFAPARLYIALAFTSLVMSFSITSAQQPAPAEPVRTRAVQMSASQPQDTAPPRQNPPSPVVIPPTVPRTGPVDLTPVPIPHPVQLQFPPLRGFVDLHAHPLGNLGFGGKVLYGGIDVGSWLPADPNCLQNVRATSEAQALGADNSTHGGPNYIPPSNLCGNPIRAPLISAFQQALGANDPPSNAVGYPTFVNWPTWSDLTHQRMWVEWIRRAYQGGLRVMVALAVNNKTLGDFATFIVPTISEPPVGATWQTIAGKNEDLPTDDKTSADIQITEIQGLVARHPDFMEEANSSADAYRIVSAGKLAVVVGMEIDHIGNFGQVFYSNGLLTDPREWQADWVAAAAPPPDAAVRAEIDRLYNEGVRYIFPIHLLDNAFGGTAAYKEIFNVSTLRESGHIWSLSCTNSSVDNISWTYNNSDTSTNVVLASISVGGNQFTIGNLGTVGITEGACSSPPANQPAYGQKNARGLTPSGIVAIKEMMRLGMLIDIDHMSEASEDQALQLACYGSARSTSSILSSNSPFVFTLTLPCPYGYPMNSGHSGLRGALGGVTNERSLRADQYGLIGYMHGMAGVGSAELTADSWLKLYNNVMQAMGGDPTFANPYSPESPVTPGSATSSAIAAGFGTDFDGLEFAMPPRQGLGRTVYGPTYSEYETCLKGPTCTSTEILPNGKPAGAVAVNSCIGSCQAKYPNAIQYVWSTPPPDVQYSASFPQPTDGSKSWNYNADGVAHYGMLWDFLQDVASLPGGAAMVNNNFMYGADYFYRTWQRAEALSKNAPQ